LEFYSAEDLATIVTRSARILNVPITEEGASELARRARGTPRIVNRLLKRARDFAEVRAQGILDAKVAGQALELLEVDVHGLDQMDRKILLTILEKFQGGPVGVETLSSAIAEEKDTIEDVYEPYLIQCGFLQRTPRGRVATDLAYQYFGIPKPSAEKRPQGSLFEGEV
jgi:Holliday junction DNA helicase RuvB